MILAQEAMRRAANKRRLNVEYNVGELVLIDPHSLQMAEVWKEWGKKFSPKYIGPLEIIEKLSPTTYRLRLPPEWHMMHNVFNIAHLEKYMESPEEFGKRDQIPLKPLRPPTHTKPTTHAPPHKSHKSQINDNQRSPINTNDKRTNKGMQKLQGMQRQARGVMGNG